MADTTTFDSVCNALEQQTSFDRLEARGTIRIFLEEAGLEPGGVTPAQLEVVIQKVLPAQLESRGVEDTASVCSTLVQGLTGLAVAAPSDTPESVFERLGST
jgi:hypothetical protein